ncbi:EthD family reductase [Bradyrhizobium sp. LHD-71]|uniref:EthD domain-containing protein n=1 Tax=Bradyrhizobium sp. LHD-71 TaxID=3072141 RepID=UPI00280D318A|nr:EthD family reductase [Bradyrhizobium sp. LHD-71]MDQ8732302.1 EthD family reductase [Bradyrhizobium sp. LHD-71]
MIKSISFLQRKPGLSREDFVRHWLDVHVPMCHAVPGLRGYAVSTVVEQQSRPDVPGLAMGDFDGVAQVWFDDLAARAHAAASAEGKRWHADGGTIIGGIRMFVTNERFVVPLPAKRPTFKTLSVIKRKPELSAEEFHHEWAVVHAPMARAVPGLRGFTLSEIVEEQFRADIPPFQLDGPLDGFTESWWDSPASRAQMIASAEGTAWFAHGSTFIGEIRSMLLEERVIVPVQAVAA